MADGTPITRADLDAILKAAAAPRAAKDCAIHERSSYKSSEMAVLIVAMLVGGALLYNGKLDHFEKWTTFCTVTVLPYIGKRALVKGISAFKNGNDH